MSNGTRIVGLDAYIRDVKKEWTQFWIKDQTRRLIVYADEKIGEIGESIINNSKGFSMEETGNLLDSLCWGVSYNGRLIQYGYYRKQEAFEESYLHSLFPPDIREMFPIYGHGLARMFIKKYGNDGKTNGWKVFFAVLAPYWAYWEKGHENVLTKDYERFAIMAEFYDKVKKDLKPTRVKFTCFYPRKYSKESLRSMYKNIRESRYREERHYKGYPTMKKRK